MYNQIYNMRNRNTKTLIHKFVLTRKFINHEIRLVTKKNSKLLEVEKLRKPYKYSIFQWLTYISNDNSQTILQYEGSLQGFY